MLYFHSSFVSSGDITTTPGLMLSQSTDSLPPLLQSGQILQKLGCAIVIFVMWRCHGNRDDSCCQGVSKSASALHIYRSVFACKHPFCISFPFLFLSFIRQDKDLSSLLLFFPSPIVFLCSSHVTVTLFRLSLKWSEGEREMWLWERDRKMGGEERKEESVGRRGITWLTGYLKAKNKCWSFSHSGSLSLCFSCTHTHTNTHSIENISLKRVGYLVSVDTRPSGQAGAHGD